MTSCLSFTIIKEQRSRLFYLEQKKSSLMGALMKRLKITQSRMYQSFRF